MNPITIHGFAPSTFTRSARMAAVEVGVEHELVPIPFGDPEHFKLHPFAKLPVLTDADVSIFETLAIVTYLDQRYGTGALFPAASAVQNLMVISAANDYAYKPIVKGETDDPDQLEQAQRVFDWLESVLQRSRQLAGPEFGAADLFIAPMLDYYLARVGANHVWAEQTNLKAWFESVTRRPSFKATAAS